VATLVVSTLVSLDGYQAGPDGDLSSMPFDAGFDAHNLERLRAAGTLLSGRVTFEGHVGFWPGLADDPTADAVHREISRINTAIDKIVVSDRFTPEDAGPWRDTTHVLPRADSRAAIAELKARPGRDIVMFGSRTVADDLMAAGLVDELYVLVGPGLLGAGLPLFSGASPRRLRLLGADVVPDSQIVRHHYDARP
jgi:dihydrofolate reductase